jgi:predicted  nucleic acid-binding Zn-ribbon protein
LQNIALLEAKSAAIENSIKEESREQIVDLKKNRELVKISLDKAGSTKNNWYASFAQEYATTSAEIETFSTEKEKLKTAIRNYSQEKTKVLSDLKEAKNRGQTPENELNALHALTGKRKELELKLEEAKRTENKLNTQLKALHEQIKTTLPALETNLPQRPEIS